MNWDELLKLIHTLIDEHKINQRWIANHMGTSPGLVSNWLKGLRIPQDRTIGKLEKVLRESNLIKAEEPNIDIKSSVPMTGENIINVPILADIPAGLPDYSEKDVEFFFNIPRFMYPGADFVIRCVGDSMYPEIPNGAYCVIRKESEPINKAIMIVKTEEGFTMKRIVKKEAGIELHPANGDHKIIRPKELRIVGEVIGTFNKIKRG